MTERNPELDAKIVEAHVEAIALRRRQPREGMRVIHLSSDVMEYLLSLATKEAREYDHHTLFGVQVIENPDWEAGRIEVVSTHPDFA